MKLQHTSKKHKTFDSRDILRQEAARAIFDLYIDIRPQFGQSWFMWRERITGRSGRIVRVTSGPEKTIEIFEALKQELAEIQEEKHAGQKLFT